MESLFISIYFLIAGISIPSVNGSDILQKNGIPPDTILGVYMCHYLRTMQFGMDGNGNCTAFDLPFPQLTTTRIEIFPGNQLIYHCYGDESRGLYDPFKHKGDYIMATGKWVQKKDTLLVEFLHETVYKKGEGSYVLQTYDRIALDSINMKKYGMHPQRYATYILTSDSSFCFLNDQGQFAGCYLKNNPAPEVKRLIPEKIINVNDMKNRKNIKKHGQ